MLNLIAHASERRASICRIVNELLIVQHGVNRVIQLVLSQKLIVIEEWNRESGRHRESGNARMNQLTEIRRLRAISDNRGCSLLTQTCDLRYRKIRSRFHHIQPLL